MDRMADSLQGKAEAFAEKVAELQGLIDSSVRDMRKLEAFRQLEQMAKGER